MDILLEYRFEASLFPEGSNPGRCIDKSRMMVRIN